MKLQYRIIFIIFIINSCALAIYEMIPGRVSLQILVGVTMLVIQAFVLHALLFKPLRNLWEHLDHVQLTGNINLRFPLPLKKDEITLMGASINSILNLMKDYQQDVFQQANQDPLTKLPNRSLFYEYLEQSIQNASNSDSKVALMFLDLDHFKQVNDTYGHQYGDDLLCQVSARMCTLRKNEEFFLFRIGGDEFTVILPNNRSPQLLKSLSEKIIAALATPFKIGEHELEISASVGIAIYPDHGRHTEEIIENADIAMYKAKENGKNGYVFYDEELLSSNIRKRKMERLLTRAIENNQLQLLFQPKIDILKKVITGVEATIQWNVPDQGIRNAEEIYLLASESGLVPSVEWWLLRSACIQGKAWMDKGFSTINISVKISLAQLIDALFLKNLTKLLQETKIAPELLEIEITDSLAMVNLETTIACLQQLKNIGVKLTISDFGKENFTLMHLKKLPIDTLKMDRSFVDEITTDPDTAAIATAIVSLSQSLNLRLLAGGIQTREQAKMLYEMGFREMQGDYFSISIQAKDFEAMMSKKTDLHSLLPPA
ncbi:EAL domain-containing protein [Acinetobacter sp. CUI P1]|nr:EAL domain-containing protein [Acinetobacter sp. CUI P1]